MMDIEFKWFYLPIAILLLIVFCGLGIYLWDLLFFVIFISVVVLVFMFYLAYLLSDRGNYKVTFQVKTAKKFKGLTNFKDVKNG